MAIKIISEGPDPKIVKRVVGHNCGATLEYTPADVVYKVFHDYGGGSDRYACFNCPKCNYHLQICQ